MSRSLTGSGWSTAAGSLQRTQQGSQPVKMSLRHIGEGWLRSLVKMQQVGISRRTGAGGSQQVRGATALVRYPPRPCRPHPGIVLTPPELCLLDSSIVIDQLIHEHLSNQRVRSNRSLGLGWRFGSLPFQRTAERL